MIPSEKVLTKASWMSPSKPTRAWWQLYEKHTDKLNDTDYLLKAMREQINPGIPVLQPISLGGFLFTR